MNVVRKYRERSEMAKSKALRLVVLFFVLGTALSAILDAQESPFIPDKLALQLRNEISGDKAFDYVRRLTHFHRIMGSQAFIEAANMMAGLAKSFGFENIQVVKQKFEGGTSWDPVAAKLWLVEPEEIKLGDFDDVSVSLAVWSRSAHLTAELVDIGRGAAPEDFAGIDVAGKVVLTTSAPGAAMKTAVWERGALGVISSYSIHAEARFDTPDHVAYVKVPPTGPNGKLGTWAFMVSARRHGQLQDILRTAKSKNLPVKVRVDIETQIREPAEQAYLWAEIKGSRVHDQDIVLTAHLDEERTSANDNGSGCASILEIGRAINALVKEGKIAPPKRDIVFWWPNEHLSEYQYFIDHSGEQKKMLASINQDMVGAKQSMGSRMQHIIRTPYSIPSYLNDVIESIADYVILTNTGFMGAEEAGTPQPFSKPILSFLGTRERYNAMVVPHSGGSDQEVFCEGVIGVPAVALINNPDAYIHSTDDDLQNIDPTQLKRNAFVVAAATLFIANAGEEDVPMLAGEVYSRALQRLGKDMNAALFHLREKKAGTYAQSYKEARNLIEQAADRERRALESVMIFASPGGRNASFVMGQINKLGELTPILIRELDAQYLQVSGERKTPVPALSAEEKELALRVPVNIDSLDDYFKKRGWSAGSPDLHPIMAKECFCFVDGKRSFLDIYRAVQAEALSAGEFYYGRVTLEAVERLLNQAVDKGILKLR
jgi:hypothetical protein